MEWKSYLSEARRVEFANPDARIAFMRLSESLTKAWSLSFGDLRYKNCAKQIVKEKTQEWLVAKGSLPWCFRFQCLITGRKSKYIRESELHLFGITSSDKKTGGHFPFAQELPDRLQPVRDEISMQLNALYEKAFQCKESYDWWHRYSQYLASEEWSNKRELVLRRDNYRCKLTGSVEHLEIHHLTYRNVGDERLDDLITLSRAAHKIVHDRRHADHKSYCDRLQAKVFANA